MTLFYNLIFEVTCALFVLDLNLTIVQNQCTFFIKKQKSIKRPSFDLVNTVVGFVSLSAGMSSHDVVAPKKRRRMDSASDEAVGGLMHLEVLNLCGECMLALHVAGSMFGRDLWKMILDKVPSKPGLQLVVFYNTARLVLNETLQQQGLGGERPKVSGTYVPINLHAAWLFAQGQTVADEEFSLVGITEVTWVGDQTPALLQNLPNSLRDLSFDENFNQSVNNVRLLAGLECLTFGYHFNKSLDNVTWPARLQSLTFGCCFNQSLDNVTWPARLQSLTFGCFFNQSLDNVTWPAGLQTLAFGDFNRSLDKVKFPPHLQSLTCGGHFDQSLDNLSWPERLQSLTLGFDFNQSLDNVSWPVGLQSLTFGWDFNQNLDKVSWPATLQNLAFGGGDEGTTGRNSSQSLDNVKLPAGLQSLTCGGCYNQSLDNLSWPEGLRSLTLAGDFVDTLDNVSWPAGLQSLTSLEILIAVWTTCHGLQASKT